MVNAYRILMKETIHLVEEQENKIYVLAMERNTFKQSLDIIHEQKRPPTNQNQSAHLTPKQERIVSVIQDRGIMGLGEICKQLALNPSNTCKTLQKLSKKGIIQDIGGGRYKSN